MEKAVYTHYELKGMSENRKRINLLTEFEWCKEWDRVTRAINRKCGFKRKDI